MAKAESCRCLESHVGMAGPPIPQSVANTTLSAKAIHHTQMTVVQTTDKLASINSRIKALQEELESLTMERDRMTEFLNSQNAPIRTIPPEVISEIFVHCLPDDVDFVRPLLRKAPLLLTQICSIWRNIALSTPRLWCSLGVISNKLYRSKSQAASMQVWLARSGACPLFLSLQEEYEHYRISPCLKVVLSHMSRCRELCLVLPRDVFTVIPRTIFPMLERIIFRPDFRYTSNPSPWANMQTASNILEVFSATPRLQSVDTNWHREILISSQCFPWSQLGDLYLYNAPSVWECLELLSFCPALMTCSLDFADTIELPAPNEVECFPIQLPRLRALTITAADNDENDTFLDYLIVPVLKHLEGKNLHVSSSFVDLLARSGCQLETLILDIQDAFFPAIEDVRTLLEHSPSLIKLSIRAGESRELSWKDSGLALLSRRRLHSDAPSSLLPKLEILELSITSFDPPYDAAVRDMLSSRLPSFSAEDDHSAMPSSPAIRFLKHAEIDFEETKFPRNRKWVVTGAGDIVLTM